MTWTTYALLQSSSGGKEWKVQINEDGQFRCNCPAFIFSGKGGVPKTCKHCRRCDEQRLKEQSIPAVVAVAPVSPSLAEATTLFDAMCRAGTSAARVNVRVQMGQAATAAMVAVLAERLATWVVPTTAPVVAAVAGIRRITFDD